MTEKRRYTRYHMDCTALVATVTQVRKVDVIDISQNGMLLRFNIEAAVTKGTPIIVMLYDRETGTLVKVKAKVVRKYTQDGHLYTGIEYKDTSEGIARIIKGIPVVVGA